MEQTFWIRRLHRWLNLLNLLAPSRSLRPDLAVKLLKRVEYIRLTIFIFELCKKSAAHLVQVKVLLHECWTLRCTRRDLVSRNQDRLLEVARFLSLKLCRFYFFQSLLDVNEHNLVGMEDFPFCFQLFFFWDYSVCGRKSQVLHVLFDLIQRSLRCQPALALP